MTSSATHLLEWEKLTSATVAKLARSVPQPVVVYAVGSLEQHGPHLPLGSDYLCAGIRAEEICRRTGSILLRTHLPGYSYQHRGFPGTITLKATTLIALLGDVFDGISNAGFQKVLVLNGHAENAAILDIAIAEAKQRHSMLRIAHPRRFPTEAAQRYQERFYRTMDIHAGAVESAIVRWYFPDLVEQPRIREVDQRPAAIARLQDTDEPDDVDRLLIETLLPARTDTYAPDGIVGRCVIGGDYPLEVLQNVHDETVEFHVEFIRRWQAVEEDTTR